MKNKFPLLIISILILMGCASNEKEEAEPPEVQLYRMAQDRINAQNYLGAVDSLARIERFYPFGVYAEQARADLIYAYYMSGDYDQAYAASEKFIRLYPRNTNVDYAYFMKGMTGYYADEGLLGNIFSLSLAKRDITGAMESYADLTEFLIRYPRLVQQSIQIANLLSSTPVGTFSLMEKENLIERLSEKFSPNWESGDHHRW